MADCNESFVQTFLRFTIGNIFGKDITCREPVYPCDAYQPGPLVDFGRTIVQGVKFLRKFLIPGGLCGAIPAIRPVPPSPDTPVQCNNEINLIRPSQLPIYTHETSSSCTTKNTTCYTDENSPSFLEQGFGTIRKNIQGVLKEYDDVMGSISNKIDTGIAHSQITLEFLREESNTLPRIGAVAIGGLTGLIFSLRGRKFKRLIYTTTGAITVAGICYPNEAKETLTASKHYINIGYNFIYGVKPGDENQLEIVWPEFPRLKIPSSFSEFFDLAGATGASLSATILSLFGNKSEMKSSSGNEEKLSDEPKIKNN
ncbi:hypothetical protein PV326_000805 [Microctonus aethiopoides]|nr:hypothetical protein PV326_000805 [Microctonus aethiopoides]